MALTSGRLTAEVVYRETGRGLKEDAQLLTTLLQSAGYVVCQTIMPARGSTRLKWTYRLDLVATRLPRFSRSLVRLRSMLNRVSGAPTFDLSIHLQSPVLARLGRAKETWLVPNQEWFRHAWKVYLPLYDNVKCKTREAERVFSHLHRHVEFLGFSGSYAASNNLNGPADTDFTLFFLHVAGRNLRKGTGELIELWGAHPSWPVLRVVTDYPDHFGPFPSNVAAFSGVPSPLLSCWRRQAVAVVAPSHVEGFGHSVLEPLAEGGLVITTDAPPMNELVDSSRGILVAATKTEPVLLGQSYRVVPAALEKAVLAAMNMSSEEQAVIREAARQWAQSNHQQFVERWTRAVVAVGGAINRKS